MASLRAKLESDLEELRSPKGYLYAGKPHYTTLFGRDALISAWQMLGHDATIARSTLLELAVHQGGAHRPLAEEEPGKILHMLEATPSPREELPDWPLPYYGSVDATPLFIFVAGEYLRVTGDEDLISSLWPSLLAACRWMVTDGDPDGDLFLEYRQHNPAALFHQSWRDSEEDHLGLAKPPIAIVEAQGYQYAALIASLEIAERLGTASELPSDAIDRLRRLPDRFDQAFWWEEESYYALGLDGDKRPRLAVTSNPGHLLFTGMLSDGRTSDVVGRLMCSDMLTPFGIRTQSSAATDFDERSYHMGSIWPHDNWIIWQGMRRSGFVDEAAELRECLLRALEILGRAPELYGVTAEGELIELNQPGPDGAELANPLQAWSSAGLLDLVLGQ